MPQSSKQKTYLVASANGYGNVGDDICAYSAKYIIEQADPHARVIITQPPFDQELAEQSDVIVLGGGGIIYDHVKDNVDNYMAYLRYAQDTQKLSLVLGVGVQGISTAYGKKQYRQYLNNADLVTVRSPEDKQQLEAVGVKSVHCTEDLGFLASHWVKQPSVGTFLRIKLRSLLRRKPRLAFIPVDLSKVMGDNFDQSCANFIEAVESNMNRITQDFEVSIFVHSRDDVEWITRLAQKHNLEVVPYESIDDFTVFWAEYKECSLVVTSRFHPIIFGSILHKPTVTLSVKEGKHTRLMHYHLTSLSSNQILYSEMLRVRDLFENLQTNFTHSMFSEPAASEIEDAQEKAQENILLVRQTLLDNKVN